MTANQSARPGRSSGPRLAAAFVAALVVGACAGENLFTGIATSDQGPTVEITSPAAGAAVAAGDSVQVSANITGTRGITQVKFSGNLDAGGAAFVTQTVALGNPPDTTLARYIRRAGTTAGNAKIIVEATDVLGDTGADTVAVVLN